MELKGNYGGFCKRNLAANNYPIIQALTEKALIEKIN